MKTGEAKGFRKQTTSLDLVFVLVYFNVCNFITRKPNIQKASKLKYIPWWNNEWTWKKFSSVNEIAKCFWTTIEKELKMEKMRFWDNLPVNVKEE